ncbi:hypothetical protein B0H66DRAFT_567954 [Apodospora peruviana]|uniref:DUF7371 domain-containing protein n=1 Tax=Apodospora peruviana TaxID=516989 RepID=A0AAE0M0A7_9PEZI|nr:hypothetical protein B0H66DRAFT_567954 [Apodospora peruviana]
MMQYNGSAAPVAQISLAQLRSNPCFRFDFIGVSLGCNSTDAPCDFNIAGIQWNGVSDVRQANKTMKIAACSDPANCTLGHQVLDSAAALQFTNLTALNITLTVAGQPQTWWADDLQISWTDNGCAAASCRAQVPNNIMFTPKSSTLVGRARGFLRWAARRRASGQI